MPGTPTATVPVAVRVKFAHASVEWVARECGADALHIKGPAVDPETNPGRSAGTDADILVRPRHVQALKRGLADAGWVLWCDFDEGSRFEHAASFHHAHFGMLDVHRSFPGIHHDPGATFDRLWAARDVRQIGGLICSVPDRLSERLILLLHAARTSPAHIDLRNHWTDLTSADRAQLDEHARRMGATVGLALATGRRASVEGDPELELWRDFGDDRLGEWMARWRAAPSARSRFALIARAPRVNRFALGERLGRPPTQAEVRREWWHRLGRGAASAWARVRVRAGW